MSNPRRQKKAAKKDLRRRKRSLGKVRWQAYLRTLQQQRETRQAEREAEVRARRLARAAARDASERRTAHAERQAKQHADLLTLIAKVADREEARAAADYQRAQDEADLPMSGPATWSPTRREAP